MTIQHAEVLRRLEREIVLNGSLRRAAIALGVSRVQLSETLLGHRAPGPKLLRALNLRQVPPARQLPVYTEVPRASAR